MKKRNKKSLQEKDFLRLKTELSKNYEAQCNLGYIELDEPIHSGYIASLCLRHDVANREDAWVFQEMIDKFGTTCYAKKIGDFNFVDNVYVTRVKNKFNPFVIYHRPHIREIDEVRYNDLAPQVRKYFNKSISVSSWRGDTYNCSVPSFYFDIKVEKYYIYKVKVYDEILDQEEAELKAEIDRKYYHENHTWYKAPKHFRKRLNKTQRVRAKKVLYDIITTGEDLVFEDCYKGADWLWW